MDLTLEVGTILGILFLAIYFSPSTVRAATIGAPFVPASLGTVKKALKLADLKPKETLYDLGSGTGRVLAIGAKKFKANVVGFEYSRPLLVFSRINLFLQGVKGQILRKDFFKDDINLEKADVIYIFLAKKAFAKLQPRLEKETRPGTRIVVYLSPLGFWQPDKEMVLWDKTKIRLYIKK